VSKTRIAKSTLIKSMETAFNETLVILCSDKGMKAQTMKELRNKIKQFGGNLQVVKNTLARIALRNVNGVENLHNDLKQSSLMISANSEDEMISITKLLIEFIAQNEDKIAVKAGLLHANYMTAIQIKALSLLPSKDEMRVNLIRMAQLPAQRLVTLMNKKFN
jgi:large subunit ribosomal protein L10